MEKQLLLVIDGPRLRKEYFDTWKWKEDEDGIYSVKIAYKTLQKTDEEVQNNEFKMLWSTRVTPKAQILGWRIFLDKLPTKDNLLKRGFNYNIVFVICVMHMKRLQTIYSSLVG